MADPSIRSSNTSDGTNVFTKPTGLADGDILYIRYTSFQNTATPPSAPSGFTSVQSGGLTHAAGDCLVGAVFRKVITSAAGEPASYTVTRVGTVFYDGGRIDAIQNADTATPEDDSGANTGTSTTPTTGANITTTVNGSLILISSTTYGQNCADPSGMTQDYEIDGGDTEGWHESITGTTLTGATRSSTIGASVEWIWLFVAVKAVSAAASASRVLQRPRNRIITRRTLY